MVLGQPLGRFTVGVASRTCLVNLSWDILVTLPNHRNWNHPIQTSGSITGLNFTAVHFFAKCHAVNCSQNSISVACTRDQGQRRHSGLSRNLYGLNATVRGLRHGNFHLFPFWLTLSLFCDLGYATMNEKYELLHSCVSYVTEQWQRCSVDARRTMLIIINPSVLLNNLSFVWELLSLAFFSDRDGFAP